MKLSVSNIAWEEKFDQEMYKYLSSTGYDGLEIAPTRIVGKSPYTKLGQATEFKKMLYDNYGLSISSMQSIWYSKTERLFGSTQERRELERYTQAAILFAKALNCNNLVFGCPRNRKLNAGDDKYIADAFFRSVAEYAKINGTVFSVEATPPIYDTNFITSTPEAFDLVKRLDAKALAVNYDLGTAICNNENLEVLRENLSLVNHIHISEPHLAPIKKRRLHTKLAELLKELDYTGFVSVEMAAVQNLDDVKQILEYIKKVFK